jgi:hypothetical protein
MASEIRAALRRGNSSPGWCVGASCLCREVVHVRFTPSSGWSAVADLWSPRFASGASSSPDRSPPRAEVPCVSPSREANRACPAVIVVDALRSLALPGPRNGAESRSSRRCGLSGHDGASGPECRLVRIARARVGPQRPVPRSLPDRGFGMETLRIGKPFQPGRQFAGRLQVLPGGGLVASMAMPTLSEHSGCGATFRTS